MAATPTAALYVRISDDDEGRALGVTRQKADCLALARREGLNVVQVYSDNDISASTNTRTTRPSWNRMLADAEAGRFEYIVAATSSRLTRKPREREDIIDLHDEHGIKPWLVDIGRPDLSTADGRQTFRLLGTVDTGEAERTAERVRRKAKELAESGRYNGPRPFGWDFQGNGADQRLVINPAEAAVVRECVERVLAGEGLWRIVNDLNERGITTTRGGPWRTQVLRRMLLRWTNCGWREHQPRKRGKPVGKPTLHKGQWEPIIDRETHERVRALLTDPARKTNNRGTAPKYLLTSVARCGECGGYMVGTKEYTYTLKNGRTRTYPRDYACNHAGCMRVRRRMDAVDDMVERTVLGVLERDGVRLLGGDPGAAEQARARIGALEAKLALAADQFADDVITGEQLRRITEKLRPQVQAERDRLAAAQPEPSLADYAGPGAAEAWAAADVETKKSLIRLLGMQITIHRVGPGNGREFDPDSVSITWAER